MRRAFHHGARKRDRIAHALDEYDAPRMSLH